MLSEPSEALYWVAFKGLLSEKNLLFLRFPNKSPKWVLSIVSYVKKYAELNGDIRLAWNLQNQCVFDDFPKTIFLTVFQFLFF